MLRILAIISATFTILQGPAHAQTRLPEAELRAVITMSGGCARSGPNAYPSPTRVTWELCADTFIYLLGEPAKVQAIKRQCDPHRSNHAQNSYDEKPYIIACSADKWLSQSQRHLDRLSTEVADYRQSTEYEREFSSCQHAKIIESCVDVGDRYWELLQPQLAFEAYMFGCVHLKGPDFTRYEGTEGRNQNPCTLALLTLARLQQTFPGANAPQWRVELDQAGNQLNRPARDVLMYLLDRACTDGNVVYCAQQGTRYRQNDDPEFAFTFTEAGCAAKVATYCAAQGWLMIKANNSANEAAQGLALAKRDCRQTPSNFTCPLLGHGVELYTKDYPLEADEIDGAKALVSISCDRGHRLSCSSLENHF